MIRFTPILPILLILSALSSVFAANESTTRILSPEFLAASDDGRTLYVTEKTGSQIAVFDIAEETVRHVISLPGEPAGLVLSPDNRVLYVTCSDPTNVLCIIDTASLKCTHTIPAGAGACSPVVSENGRRVYVCNRYENSVSVIDLDKRDEILRVPAGREPAAAAITPDDRFLFVACHLPAGPADTDFTASSVHVIHAQKLQTAAEIPLPNGSTSVQDVCISPDGRYVFVTHLLARYTLPTTQLDRGWMTNNALTVIDAAGFKIIATILLDSVDRGAANPWGIDCSTDGRMLCVAHAGTHELSRIDLPDLMEKIASLPTSSSQKGGSLAGNSSSVQRTGDPSTDLTFVKNLRHRIPLKGIGPRDVAIVDGYAYVTNFFSDSLDVVDLTSEERKSVRVFPLGPEPAPSQKRKGEILFHDAGLCFQGWQSCASCHPDGRTDGLNWDLLNDGVGNPKNTKSLLLSHKTPPAMSLGARANAEEAVRSGFKHILFSVRPEEESAAIDEYLKSLSPMKNMSIRSDELSVAIERGRKLFFSETVGCADCHGTPYYTDMRSYNVGTKGIYDRHEEFDTPTLVELWRTGPYLHDGSAASLHDVLTAKNLHDQHGKTSHLNEEEISDLVLFLSSL